MRTRILQVFLFIITLAITSNCTRNNGDIGPLFGTWHMTSISINDEEISSYSGTVYFSFQSTVHLQKLVDETTYDYDERYSLWRYEGNNLVLDFSDPYYTPLEITGMKNGINVLTIEKLKGDVLVLSYINPEGDEYTYTFRKW